MQYDPAAAAASFILNYSRAELKLQTHMSLTLLIRAWMMLRTRVIAALGFE